MVQINLTPSLTPAQAASAFNLAVLDHYGEHLVRSYGAADAKILARMGRTSKRVQEAESRLNDSTLPTTYLQKVTELYHAAEWAMIESAEIAALVLLKSRAIRHEDLAALMTKVGGHGAYFSLSFTANNAPILAKLSAPSLS